MTSIILGKSQKNQFNLVEFYTARVNRIVPVLSVACLTLLIFGWFYLIPNDYETLGRQVEKSILFYSNHYFSRGAGYFETSETSKWLLHTWSLSVEWQFYIFFPLIIIFIKRYLGDKINEIVFLIFLASLFFSIYYSYKDSIEPYFMLSTRVWEMLLGGLAFLYPLRLTKTIHQYALQSLGLILVLSSYIVFSKETVWPGFWATIPTLGAYFIIQANLQHQIVLSNPISQYIGKWSYSIYVWHWPLVVLGFYLTIEDWYLYGLPGSILLGLLSYQWIEKRKFPVFHQWKELYKAKPVYLFAVVLCLGIFVKESKGVANHYSENIRMILQEANNNNPYACDFIEGTEENVYECIIGNDKNIKAVVVGDSHADAITTAVAAGLDIKHEGIVSIVRAGCPLIKEFNLHKDDQDECLRYNKNRLAVIQSEKYQDIPVIIAGRYAAYIDGQNDPERADAYVNRPVAFFGERRFMSRTEAYQALSKNFQETVCEVSEKHPVYLMQQIPEFTVNIPKKLARDELLNKEAKIELSKKDYFSRSAKSRQIVEDIAKECGAKVLDPMPILCPDNNCIYQHEGRIIYRDGDHLSEYGNKLLVPLFKNII